MGANRTGKAGPGFEHPDSRDEQVARLADLLVASLETLAKLGQADAACRGAGSACAVLREANPAQWRKFNALQHRLSRHVHWDGDRGGHRALSGKCNGSRMEEDDRVGTGCSEI